METILGDLKAAGVKLPKNNTDIINTRQAAKSSGAKTIETFTEEGRAFGYKEESRWAEKTKNRYCYASH